MSEKYDYEETRFKENTKNHQMTITLDQDIYRHLRFKNPNYNAYWFDITTWEGFLCISGDMGCYVFSRLHDMFDFFRIKDNQPKINPYYWGKKIQTNIPRKELITEWSKKLFKENLREYLNDSISCLPLSKAKKSVKNVKDNILHCNDEAEFFEALREFKDDSINFEDFFDYSCNEYTYHYLWCCYAIVWAIQQYDNFKSEVANA